MRKTATIFVHQKNLGSCLFGTALEEKGFVLRTIRANAEDLSQFDPLEPDLLLVMGGPIGVYQADEYPFLHQEIDILKRRIAADKSTLGICLGSQLLAKAIGGHVYKGHAGREAGWRELFLTPAGEKSPARHFGADQTKILQWHGDTFDLPPEAVLLASGEVYHNQIFQAGRRCVGIQCHPEVTHERMLEWYVGLVDEVTGPNPVVPLQQLREETERYVDMANAKARAFFDEWLEEVGLLPALQTA